MWKVDDSDSGGDGGSLTRGVAVMKRGRFPWVAAMAKRNDKNGVYIRLFPGEIQYVGFF